MDQNLSWKTIEIVKNKSCNYLPLLPTENIRGNIELFMKLVNASSSNLRKNLTKEVINRGAKMFLHLNSCPRTEDKDTIRSFFNKVFEKYLFEPTNSGMILYTLNAMKLFPSDGRIIASKILEKISTSFGLSSIQSQKLNLSREAAKGMLMNTKF